MNNIKDNPIHDKIVKFHVQLSKLGFEELMSFSIRNQSLISDQYLASNNIESLEIGVSGYLLYLLEFYKNKREKPYLLKIKSITEDLILYCKNNKTSNYSLYTGRAGFVYYLLQLYDILKDEYLLRECIELIKPCGEEYLESIYTSDYLYNGRAGTLLVLIDLYQLTHSEEVMRLIDLYTIKISQNAYFSEEGISWKVTEEINLKNSCSFALGSSGILYVLKKANSCFPNEAIDYIIKNAVKHVKHSWNEEKSNWQNNEKIILNKEVLNLYKEQYKNNDSSLFEPTYDIGWALGKAGIQLSFGVENISIDASEIQINKLSNNIYDGIAGIGLCLMNNPRENSDMLLAINDFLLGQKNLDSLNKGLLFGDLGVHYFLLKFASNRKNNNIVYPGITIPKKNDVKLSLKLEDIKKLLLKKYYNSTITFLEMIAPNSLKTIISNPKINENEVVCFEEFIANELKINQDVPAHDLLNDVYSFERKRNEFIELDSRSSFQIYLDELLHKEKLFELLNNPDEWIYNQEIRISDSLEIVNSKWNWVSQENFNFMENFYKSPKFHSYIFLGSYENSVLEYSLDIDAVVVHRFNEGNTMNQALQEIIHYCNEQPRKEMEQFSHNIGCIDFQDLMDRLDFLVTHKIKQLLHDGILEFVL